MRKFGILVLSLSLFGCAVIKKPTSEQVEGTWEHTSYLYVRLQLDGEGNGFAVVPIDESDS